MVSISSAFAVTILPALFDGWLLGGHRPRCR